jgi:hypothetical protein
VKLGAGLIVTLYMAFPPRATVCEAGFADSEKSGTGGGAVTVMPAVPETPPLAACTVPEPATAPALYKPVEETEPTPLETVQVNDGCGLIALPFWS